MNNQRHDGRMAHLFLFLTAMTFCAYALGGGPSAYSAQMNAVPVLMVAFTLYYTWKAMRGSGERR